MPSYRQPSTVHRRTSPAAPPRPASSIHYYSTAQLLARSAPTRHKPAPRIVYSPLSTAQPLSRLDRAPLHPLTTVQFLHSPTTQLLSRSAPLPFPLSPYLLVSLSPCLLVSLSPCLLVCLPPRVSPYFCLSPPRAAHFQPTPQPPAPIHLSRTAKNHQRASPSSQNKDLQPTPCNWQVTPSNFPPNATPCDEMQRRRLPPAPRLPPQPQSLLTPDPINSTSRRAVTRRASNSTIATVTHVRQAL